MLHSVALQAKQSCVSEIGRHKKHNILLPAFLIPALLCMFQNIPKQKDSTSEPSRWGGYSTECSRLFTLVGKVMLIFRFLGIFG